MCSVTISRHLVLGVSVSRSLASILAYQPQFSKCYIITCTPLCLTRRLILLPSSISILQRPLLLHKLADRIQRRQRTQIPFASLTLNSTGALLPTSCEKGTVIKVWSIPGTEKLYKLRRYAREVRNWLMNSHLVGSLLAVSSERGTVRVFRFGSGKQGSRGSVNALGSASASSGPTGGGSSPPESVDGAAQRVLLTRRGRALRAFS